MGNPGHPPPALSALRTPEWLWDGAWGGPCHWPGGGRVTSAAGRHWRPGRDAVSLRGVRDTVQGQGPQERWAHMRGCGDSQCCRLRTETGSRQNRAETAVRRLEPRKALGRPGGDRVTNRRHLLLQRCPGPLGEGGSEPWEVPTKLTGQVTERSTRTAFRARARLEVE